MSTRDELETEWRETVREGQRDHESRIRALEKASIKSAMKLGAVCSAISVGAMKLLDIGIHKLLP